MSSRLSLSPSVRQQKQLQLQQQTQSLRSPLRLHSPARPGTAGSGYLSSSPLFHRPQQPQQQQASADDGRPRDFSFLLHPEIYHPLSSAASVPAAFRDSANLPASGTPLPDLVAAGQFRAAAIAAAQQLSGQLTGQLGEDSRDEDEDSNDEDSSSLKETRNKEKQKENVPIDPTDHVRIFSLLYTRLVCLVLIDATPLAAQEAKALEDLNSSFYLDPATGAHLVPWELRVLIVRLQAIGSGDLRRAVMSYHDLAREARLCASEAMAQTRQTKKTRKKTTKKTAGTRTVASDSVALWKGRVAELGLRVAGALIEMEDLAGASALLANMSGSMTSSRSSGRSVQAAKQRRKVDSCRALLWLHAGDAAAARAVVLQLLPQQDGEDEEAEQEEQDQQDQQEEQEKRNASINTRAMDALCEMADDNYDKALDTWQDLREDVPLDEMVAVNLAVCFLYVGRMQEGRDVLEGLVERGYSSHSLLFHLSTVYELCTDRAKNTKRRLAQRMADRKPGPDG